MKKLLFFLPVLLLVTLACNLAAAVVPPAATAAPQAANTPIPVAATALASPLPPTAAPSATPVVQPTALENTLVTFGRLSLEIPAGVAAGASGEDIPRLEGEEAPWWEKTPGHLHVSLGDYYVLQGKLHEPLINVYPALDYAVLVPAAFESMHRLDNIFAEVDDQLPAVPFFNAAPVFASNVQLISFQNGKGVRTLTAYAQAAAPVNNHELFYHFEGLTADGAYYIVAILPVTAPALAETGDPGAAVPAGGIAPPDGNDANADWAGYYAAITNLLDGTSPEAFTPTIGQLDALIQSMWVNP